MPMMIQTACLSVMSWELTKPTTMTVVADEDWMIAVIPAPTNTPKNRVGSQPLQNLLHAASGCGFQIGAHHLHAVQK